MYLSPVDLSFRTLHPSSLSSCFRQSFCQYVDAADNVIRSRSICCEGSSHQSSPENKNFKSLGGLTLRTPPLQAIQELEQLIDGRTTLPSIVPESHAMNQYRYSQVDTGAVQIFSFVVSLPTCPAQLP